jgi:sortase A
MFGPLLSRRSLEALVLLGGVLLLGIGISAIALSEIRRAEALEQVPDMQAWSNGAKARYLAAREADPAAPLGILHIPSVRLDAPVYADDSSLNLDRGAAIIAGMAYPHELGHIGIAGHRDGYFRSLRELKLGDRIRLDTLYGPKEFVVDDLRVVEPDDLSLLAETRDQRLTIVTCYPFHFVGKAPQRYLVRAALITDDASALAGNP